MAVIVALYVLLNRGFALLQLGKNGAAGVVAHHHLLDELAEARRRVVAGGYAGARNDAHRLDGRGDPRVSAR